MNLSRRPRHRTSGFTLLELLVVMALIGVLMGLGVGLLQRRGDDLDIALAVIRDRVRVAALLARTRGVPTEVELRAATQDAPATVRSRVPRLVGQWHMEAELDLDDDGLLDAQVSGLVESGRYGLARRPDADAQRALLDVATGGLAMFDLRDGFALRVDLLVDEREEMVVARLGSSLDLRVDGDGILRAVMVATEGGQRAAGSTRLNADAPLRLGHWYRLGLVHDGRFLRLTIDDREVDRAAAILPLLQTSEDHFQISPADTAVCGLVDEVVLEGYERAAAQALPAGVELVAVPESLRFGRNGELFAPARFLLRAAEEERVYRVVAGGIVE